MVQRSAESLGRDGMSEHDERLRSVPVCVCVCCVVCVCFSSLSMYILPTGPLYQPRERIY